MCPDYFSLPGVYFGPDTGGARGRMKASHDRFGLSFKLNATSLSSRRQNKPKALSGRRQLPAQTFNRDLIIEAFFISLLASPTTYHG